MPDGKAATDFDEIIQADRQRRKNEALAKQVFGSGRRGSAPGAGVAPRKPGAGPSLASRIGVIKRSSSAGMKSSTIPKNGRQTPTPVLSRVPPKGDVDAEWTHDLHDSNNPGPSQVRRGKPMGAALENRFYTAINGSPTTPALSNQFNVVGPSNGMSIRGIAGPCAVRAQNFARGTTAADIESAMSPIGGKIIHCTIISERPNVIAEIVFETKEGAENAIETFNNQTADGHVLRLYIKPGPIVLPPSLQQGKSEPIKSAVQATPPTAPRATLTNNRSDGSSGRYGVSDRYKPINHGRAGGYDREDDEVMDGSYGFEDQMDTDDPQKDSYTAGRGRGLYSDDLITKQAPPRGPRGGRNGFERGRGRGDSRDRNGRGDRQGYR